MYPFFQIHSGYSDLEKKKFMQLKRIYVTCSLFDKRLCLLTWNAYEKLDKFWNFKTTQQTRQINEPETTIYLILPYT